MHSIGFLQKKHGNCLSFTFMGYEVIASCKVISTISLESDAIIKQSQLHKR